MTDNLVPIGGSWGAAECLVCGRSWKLAGPIETEVPRCPSGCFDEDLQGRERSPDTPSGAIIERDAEIARLRAALAASEGREAKLRAFAQHKNNCAPISRREGNCHCGLSALLSAAQLGEGER